MGVVYSTLLEQRDAIAGRLAALWLPVPVAVLGTASRRVGPAVVPGQMPNNEHPLAALLPDDLQLGAALLRPLRIDHESP